MRFLLFIALALLPLSDTLKCYDGFKVPNSPEEKVVEQCDPGVKTCRVQIDSMPMGGSGTFWSCGFRADCNEKSLTNGCETSVEETEVMGQKIQVNTKTCCCKGDLCNDMDIQFDGGPKSGGSNPATVPTALISLAAAAAVLAARI